MRLTLLILLLSLNMDISIADSPYPDTDYPDATPKVFAKGLISLKDQNEFRMFISPDSMHYYFSIFDTKYKNYRIVETHFKDNQWTKVKNFSATTLGDLEPFISADGQRFYFSSNRKPAKNRQDSNIWVMENNKGVWQNPSLKSFNSIDSEWVVSETLSGNIYFARFDKNDIANIMLYQNSITSMVPIINQTNSSDYEPYIDPHERFIIFSSNRKQDSSQGKPVVNLYISINKGGEWQAPVKMGDLINNGKSVYSPLVSPDQKFLFFNREGDMQWVDFKLSIKLLELTIMPMKP